MEGLIQLPSKSFQVLNHGLCQLGRSISHPTLSCSKLLRLKNATSERAILDHCCVFSVAHLFFHISFKYCSSYRRQRKFRG